MGFRLVAGRDGGRDLRDQRPGEQDPYEQGPDERRKKRLFVVNRLRIHNRRIVPAGNGEDN